MQRIYFDNNATTPIAPEVREAMRPYLESRFGNPSSNHRCGEEAKNALEEGREQVAGLLRCHPARLTFTSGGSEANNTAIWSAVNAFPEKRHIIASRVEHASVLKPLEFLQGRGYDIELLAVDEQGALDLDRLDAAINKDTLLVSLMGANNESGVLWPVAEIGAICRRKSVLFHCDAIQMLGKLALAVEKLPVDYLSVASHKMHGPKGIGALYVGRSTPFFPLIMGADQENGRRAGTENVAGIVGFGAAAALARPDLEAAGQQVAHLRDTLEKGICERIADVKVNGAGMPRLANTLNISFKHCSSASIIQELDERGIAVSAHSACQSGDLDPSHVLSAMQVPEDYRHGTLRISLSRYNTMVEVEQLLAILPPIITKSRAGFAA